jgi:hypothetical protein
MQPVVLHCPAWNPRGPTEFTLGAGPEGNPLFEPVNELTDGAGPLKPPLEPVNELTDGAGPRAWANNVAELSKSPKINIALFTGSSYSHLPDWELLPLLLLDP